MIHNYASLKAAIVDWTKRDDLEGKEDTFIAPVVADAATLLNIYVTDTYMAQRATEGQNSIIVPVQFCGILELFVGGNRYFRKSLREVQDREIRNSFAVYGERVWFYPAATAGDLIRMEFRAIIRDGGGGVGVDVDRLGQLFHRQEPTSGLTVKLGDAQGRYPFQLDELKFVERDGSKRTAYVDEIAFQYNAGERLIERFPNVFLYGALANAYEYIQDEERAAYWRGRYSEQVGLAREQLTAAQYGGAPLRIQPRHRRLFNGVR